MSKRSSKKKKFSLSLYRWPAPDSIDRPQFGGNLDFEIHTGNLSDQINPVLDTLPVHVVDYGHLFAYLFRRFGFPNMGSDSYKDIAQWLLATPHPHLVLCVRPHVLPAPVFSFIFMTTVELSTACHHWERQDVDAWTERKLDWVEAQGLLPAWMPEFLASYQEHEWPGATWRDGYRGYIAMFTPRDGEAVPARTEGADEKADHKQLMTEFAAKVQEYEQIEPRPAFRQRSTVIAEWPNDDPMKPLALAAIEALHDLATGVRVRDSAINAYGVLEDDTSADILTEPDGAGLGIAGMINEAPKESLALYQVIRKMGDGDIKTGITRLLEKTENLAELAAPEEA